MKIPEGWLGYTSSARISGTRFIACKVPLKKEYWENLLESERFTSADLLNRYPTLKLVIDLTFTGKYYNGYEEFESKGVRYIKISLEGHTIPSDECYKQFSDTMDEFLKNTPPDYLVGVHCTHGVNRTGYVIVRYMVERLGYSGQEALTTINVNDPTLVKIAQELNLAEMLLLQYLKEVKMNEGSNTVLSQKAAVGHLSQLVVKELEYLRKVKNSEVVDVTGSFATFKSEDGEFLVTVVPEEELQRSFHPVFCFKNIKPRFAKPVSSRENFAVPSPSAESVYYDACYDLPVAQAQNSPKSPVCGKSIFGLLSYIFASTIGKMDAMDGQTLFNSPRID